jgi:ABC-type glycerol-3-phosphate transport system substrate-binding protein
MSKKTGSLAAAAVIAILIGSCYPLTNARDIDDSALRVLWFRPKEAYVAEKMRDPNFFDMVWSVVDEYEARTGITVEVIAPAWFDGDFISARLEAMVREGQRVDLTWMNMWEYHNNLHYRTLCDIRDYVDIDDGFWYPGVSRAFTADDVVYGAGVVLNPLLVYYNADLFDAYNAAAAEEDKIKTPKEYYDDGAWTWDNFRAVAEALSGRGKKGFGWTDRDWVAFMAMNGVSALAFADVHNPEGTYRVANNFLSDEALHALTFAADFHKSGYVNNGDFFRDFRGGNIGMILHWAGGQGEFNAVNNLGYAPLPAGPDADAGIAGLGGDVHGYGIPVTCGNGKGAAAFMRLSAEKYLEHQERLAADKDAFKVREAAAKRSLFAPFDDGNFAYGLPGPLFEGPWGYAHRAIRDGLSGVIEPVYFLDSADKFIRVASRRAF